MWAIQNVGLALAGTVLIWLVVLLAIAEGETEYRAGFGVLLLVGVSLTFLGLLRLAAYVNSLALRTNAQLCGMGLLLFLMAVWFLVNRVNTALYRRGDTAGFGCTLLIMLVLFVFIGIRFVQLF